MRLDSAPTPRKPRPPKRSSRRSRARPRPKCSNRKAWSRQDRSAVPVTVKALFFDVFGTMVDWRGSIARESETILKPLGHALDWLAFADAWRGEYQPAMDQVRDGHIPFVKLDVLHRQNLDEVMAKLGIAAPEEVLRHLNLAWHRLDAWPDVPPGMGR